MQIGHESGKVAVGCDQGVVHVAGMAGGVAQTVEAGNFGETEQQLPQPPVGAIPVPRRDRR